MFEAAGVGRRTGDGPPAKEDHLRVREWFFAKPVTLVTSVTPGPPTARLTLGGTVTVH